MQRDERGHPMTTDSAEAARALDLAIHNFLHWRAAIMPNIQAALAADPGFGFGHVVLGLVLHGARNAHYRGKIGQAVAAAQAAAARMTARERLYLAALEAVHRGALADSVACYELILEQHPHDLFAQRLAQMELFWIGEMAWSAAISAAVHPHWTPDVPSYGIHLSCRAFDLEETHHFAAAESLARRAVGIDPTDVWGTHAVAHVLIMEGRYAEGVDWLDGLKDNWAEANQMQLHLWWHRCLFHLELRDYDAVLGIYDRWVRNRDLPLLQAVPDLYIDLQNGASMLLRLELRGVDVGDRWAELAELTLNRIGDHTSPFTSAHFAAILAATGHDGQAATLVDAMQRFAHDDDGTLAPRYAIAGIPAAKAAIAHRAGDHGRVIELLLPARRMLWLMGGSHAQRDLFFLLLADSAMKARRDDVLGIVLRDIAAAGFADPAGRVGYSAVAARLAAAE
ncbi:MAG: tetratricopeptide repeat protein [Alphaproteobacteria bacterium]